MPLRVRSESLLGVKSDVLTVHRSLPVCTQERTSSERLGMSIHELCTNAVKHGALSAPSGRVSISWSILSKDNLKRFKFLWKERGGPPVHEPSRKSFGSRLIEQALPGQLHGEARLRFEPDGLSCEINIPLNVMQERPLALVAPQARQ
jgi:two-component sensor histidine kinase